MDKKTKKKPIASFLFKSNRRDKKAEAEKKRETENCSTRLKIPLLLPFLPLALSLC